LTVTRSPGLVVVVVVVVDRVPRDCPATRSRYLHLYSTTTAATTRPIQHWPSSPAATTMDAIPVTGHVDWRRLSVTSSPRTRPVDATTFWSADMRIWYARRRFFHTGCAVPRGTVGLYGAATHRCSTIRRTCQRIRCESGDKLADTDTDILARMSARTSVSVSASWNAGYTQHGTSAYGAVRRRPGSGVEVPRVRSLGVATFVDVLQQSVAPRSVDLRRSRGKGAWHRSCRQRRRSAVWQHVLFIRTRGHPHR